MAKKPKDLPQQDEKKEGRPSSYKPEYAEQARNLCPHGATDAQLADFFGVAERTIANWKTSQPEFLHALKEGKAEADNTIVSSLFERAKGYEYDEAQPVKLKTVIYENGKRIKEEERVEIVMVHRVVPPDTTACIFWLKNRRKDAWRDRNEVDVTSNGKTILTGEERRSKILDLLKRATAGNGKAGT